MPVKKTATKKTSKKSGIKKKKVAPTDAELEAIRKLVDDIPAMIKREGYLPEKPVERVVKNAEMVDAYLAIRQKKIWLWAGAGIFTALIFVLWALNVKTIIYDMRGNTSAGETLLKNGKDEFKSVFEAIKKNDIDLQKKLQVQDTNASIKQTLKEILLPIITPSTMTSTTLNSKI